MKTSGIDGITGLFPGIRSILHAGCDCTRRQRAQPGLDTPTPGPKASSGSAL